MRGFAALGMADEAKTALAAFFQMRGRPSVTEAEFVHETSYRLRWFTPKDAQRLLQAGMDRGLLQAEEGNVQATFDVASVPVPVNYRPGPEALAPPKPADLFPVLVSRLGSATGQSRQVIVARINQAQERLGVDAAVAAAHVARSLGVDVSDVLPDLEAEVLRLAR